MVADSGTSASIDLDADSSSAGAARSFLRQTLAGWGCAGELVDDALLATTELVTNAVLYADPPLSARVVLQGELLRIAVRDGSALLPAPRHYGPDATTGRGLGLLDAVGRWGTELLPSGLGKEVWVELGGETGQADVAVTPSVAVPRRDQPMVRFLGVPVGTYLALEAHNDALLREFDLLAESATAMQGGAVPDRLAAIASEVRGQFSTRRAAYRRDVEAAAARGQSLVDLATSFAPSAAEPSVRYIDLLEEAETFAQSGDILIEPAPAPVARLRRWFVDEMVAQLVRGEPPHPAPHDARSG